MQQASAIILVHPHVDRNISGTQNFIEGSILFRGHWPNVIDRVKIPTFLNESKLDFKTSFFKITMQRNHATILEPPLVCNHVTPLWYT
jgi:hypothetical protein